MSGTVLSPAVRRGIEPRHVPGPALQLVARATGVRLGIDYAWHGPVDPVALKRAGVTFVARYLSHTPAKNLSPSEAALLSRHGIDIAVVWETSAHRPLSGRAGGQADAQYALSQAMACGMPVTRPIYFAIDWDATGGQVIDYFHGVADVLGVNRTGAYGGIRPIAYLLDHGAIRYGWQTYAWSGGRRDARAQLYQYRNGVRVAGIDSDWDRAYAADFGQWRTGGVVPIGTQPARRYNAGGEVHNDVYAKPEGPVTTLRYPNGEPTGAVLETDKLNWLHDGQVIRGRVQLDFKERTAHGDKHYVFARGGGMADGERAEYGAVHVADLVGPLGDPVPPGNGRGDPAARTDRLVVVNVQEIPADFYYKDGATHPGSKFATYGDAGAKYGRPGAYTYQCWSTVRTEAGKTGTAVGDVNPGGGLVRALIPNGGHVWLCDVERVHTAALDKAGNRIGTVTWAYVERTDLFGWMVVAHQRAGGELVHHIV